LTRRTRPLPALVGCLLALAAGGLAGPALREGPAARASTLVAPPHHAADGFRNPNPAFAHPTAWVRVRSYVGRVGRLLEEAPPPLAPAAPAESRAALAAASGAPTVTWIGHSTVLVRLDGVTILTDPHWGDRAGPLAGRIGVSRYTPPGLAFEDLPPIDVVLVSHDHYDHLDEPTVQRLARAHRPRFVVPLGLRAWLADAGVADVVELDWGESTTVRGLRIVCTPAQHYSGRTPFDQGQRLWASWVVLGRKRFYFAGDSGYYRHFREIGQAFGPFDLAALPIGSYAPRATTRAMHTSPEEALQAWVDLRARRFLGIHWGTFALPHEPADEPPRRLAEAAARRRLPRDAVWTLRPGETRTW
jgi:L-ascorbate metabolism protein UlaG (beta-lactamase superfamily)